ncbi:MAG: thiol-disulfide isomerase/thioredoxin [Rhodothermales bacterium]|jgi:thiol-disulfide isomerase/thioredoxin
MVFALVILMGSSAASAQEVGTRAPELQGSNLAGEEVRWATLEGQVVVLDFWASWCGPCREELPFLAGLAEEFKDMPVTFIGINVDEKDESRRQMLDGLKLELPFTQIHDAAGANPQAFQLLAMPSTVVVDGTGMVRYRHAGFRTADGPRLREAIVNLIEKK